jgi:hypothetical protein
MRHLESVSRVRTAVLTAVLAGLLGGCIVPIPAKATASRSANLPPSGQTAVVVLFSPDFSPQTPPGLGRDMVRCITRGVEKAAPGVRLVSEKDFHHALFAARPGEVLLRHDTIADLFARPAIAQRVRDLGLTHLVLVAGETSRQGAQVAGGAAGPCCAAVMSEATKSTRLAASIFELRQGAEATRVEAGADGHQLITVGVALLPFALGWIPVTESPSCAALGAEVARTLGQGPADEDR